MRRWIITIVSFAAALGASAYIVYSSWQKAHAVESLPARSHLLALGAWALELGSRALKIWLSARAFGVRLPFAASLRTCLGGDFGAAITPARSGAEPARYLILREAGVRRVARLLILFTELFFEMISIGLVALALGVALRASDRIVSSVAGMVGGYAAFVLGTGGVALLLSRHHAIGPPPSWARAVGLHPGRWRVVQRWLRHVRDSVHHARTARRDFLAASLAASVVHVGARLLVLPAILYPIGIRIPRAQLLLWPLAILYGAAVVPAPGGGGAVEVAFKATLGARIPVRALGTTLVWWRFYTFYLYILVGALVAGGTVMRALKTAKRPKSPSEEACRPA